MTAQIPSITEQITRIHDAVGLPEYQHPDGCDCGYEPHDCRCAERCEWRNYDGAGRCTDMKEDFRDDYCPEHMREAEATRYDDEDFS